MALLNRKKLDLPVMTDIENAIAEAEQNRIDIGDITEAIVELGELCAAQDDAIVELAEIINE